jgi:cyclic pyranopterin phosphate synthase
MSDDPEERPQGQLSHIAQGPDGAEARMVDVGGKPVTARSALARACVCFPSGLLQRVLSGGGPKGPVTEVARAAGILAAKRTGELIPMCHPLGLDHVEVAFEAEGDVLTVSCRASCQGRTGIEMEALVGASIAALTVYDMTKALDPAISIEAVQLIEKRGGKSGSWARE